MKRIGLLLSAMLLSLLSFGQATGFIEGKVTDSDGKPLRSATVEAREGGILKASDKTDNFGKYLLKPLTPGSYTVLFKFTGKADATESDIQVSAGSGATVNQTLSNKSTTIGGVTVKGIKKPKLIDGAKIGEVPPITAKTLEKMASTNVLDAAKNSARVYQAKKGGELSLGGGRTGNNIYIVDGIVVRDAARAGLVFGSVEQLQVLVGGIPANIGDATGGAVVLNSKGPSARHTGSLNVQQSIDGFNTRQINFNLRGPLLKKKTGGVTRSILGYTLSASAQNDVDPDPAYYGYTIIKPEVVKRLQENPLVAVPNSTGRVTLSPASEYLTANDFTTIRARQNAGVNNYSVQTKLDYAPTTAINLQLGLQGIMSNFQDFSFGNSMMSSEFNPGRERLTGRGYLRFKQNLSTQKTINDSASKAKQPLIDKAFYTMQLSYEKNSSGFQHDKHQDNIFAYNYLGKYKQTYRSIYVRDTTAGGLYANKFLQLVPTELTFTPDDSYNPNYTAYNKATFGILGNSARSIDGLRAVNGLANGDGIRNTHGLFASVGDGVDALQKTELDQVSLSFDASFDINTGIKRSEKLGKDVRGRHSIEFGLYAEQRTSRSYTLSSNAGGNNNIWFLMRNSANRHIDQFDFANPIFRIDGVNYSLEDINNGAATVSIFDTVNFNRKFDASKQSYFAKNIRKKLNLDPNGLDFINIDELSPTDLSLDMFSADDLYNNGSTLVDYFGYNHLGQKTKSRPSFEDFWKKKDANGNYERPVAPFQPLYVAGYIQDNFKFKDIRFRLGVRIDRFDANQKVLRDPYSLFPTLKVSDLANSGRAISLAKDQQAGNSIAPNPLNNADFSRQFADATVYVDNNAAPSPTIIGYRIGDNWYDPFGKQVSDPQIISNKYAGGNELKPFLQNPADNKEDRLQSEDYDVNAAFTDYKPRINVSPRVSFSFPIQGDKSLFYAHYDVITQRPSNVFVSPDNYFFANQQAQSERNNANLSPERRIDYEFGFQQLLTDFSSVKISAFYIERKDQIQLQRFASAYPITYTTFGNRDFSTVKGTTVEYNLRGNPVAFPLDMTVAYTLQFADGTGSSSTSQRSLINSGQPSLRTVLPLNVDSRHMVTVNANYDFGSMNKGSGPKMGRFYPLKGASLNVTANARSGEPYTKSSLATPVTGGNIQGGVPIVGTIQGSRRPGTFNTDVRLDKSFGLVKFGKKNELGARPKTLSINTFIQSQNIFNTRNVLGVYGYTGLADDDGYLASPQGILQTNAVNTSQQSYTDFYNIRMLSPGLFSNPRSIVLGVTLGF
jgi:hypothetical protein